MEVARAIIKVLESAECEKRSKTSMPERAHN